MLCISYYDYRNSFRGVVFSVSAHKRVRLFPSELRFKWNYMVIVSIFYSEVTIFFNRGQRPTVNFFSIFKWKLLGRADTLVWWGHSEPLSAENQPFVLPMYKLPSFSGKHGNLSGFTILSFNFAADHFNDPAGFFFQHNVYHLLSHY